MVVAANLGDARESDTEPAAELALGGRKLAPPDPPAWRGGVRAGALALWLVLALLLAEWVSYHGGGRRERAVRRAPAGVRTPRCGCWPCCPPALWLFGRRSLADFSRGQLRVQALLRALVLAGVAAALAGPTLRRPARAVSAVALVDVSDSVSDGALAFATAGRRAGPRRRRARRSAAARRPLRRARRGGRAAGAPRRAPARPGRRRHRPGAGGRSGRGPGRRDRDPAPAADLGRRPDARRSGRRGRAPARSRHAALRARRCPPRARRRRGRRASPRPTTSAPAPRSASTSSLLADRAARGARPPRRRRRAARRDRRARADRHAGARRHDRRVHGAHHRAGHRDAARARDGGRRRPPPENDEGVLAIATERDPRVLCLEGTPGRVGIVRARARRRAHRRRRPRRARAAARPRLRPLRPGRAGRRAARRCCPSRRWRRWTSFVRDGGGLLVAGGTQSFGPGGYTATRLEAMLPVRLDIPERARGGDAGAGAGDRQVGLDGRPQDGADQGGGARHRRGAARPPTRSPSSCSTARPTPVVRLQRAANRQRILGDIARITASGGTNILAGLREAVDELLPARARKKHIILLSDGQSPDDEIPELVDAATRRAHHHLGGRRRRGRRPDAAQDDGDPRRRPLLSHARSRQHPAHLLARDVASSATDRSSSARPPCASPSSVAALAGVPLETAPALGGYVVTRPRAAGRADAGRRPTARRCSRAGSSGSGQVAAWTSDLARAGRRRGRAGRRSRSCGRRWRARPCAARAATHFPLRSRAGRRPGAPDRRRGRRRRPLPAGLDGSVQVIAVGPGGPAAPRAPLPLAETAPGRYEASFRPDIDDRRAAVRGDAVARGAQSRPPTASGRMTLPFAPELRPQPARGDGAAARRAARPCWRPPPRARAAASSPTSVELSRPAATTARPASRCARRSCW